MPRLATNYSCTNYLLRLAVMYLVNFFELQIPNTLVTLLLNI